MSSQEQTNKFVEAIAEFIGQPVEQLAGFVIGIEWIDPAKGRPVFTDMHRCPSQWALKGYLKELQDKQEREEREQRLAAITRGSEGADAQ